MPKVLPVSCEYRILKTDQSIQGTRSINSLEMSKSLTVVSGTVCENISLEKQGLMVARMLLEMQGENKSLFLLSLKLWFQKDGLRM